MYEMSVTSELQIASNNAKSPTEWWSVVSKDVRNGEQDRARPECIQICPLWHTMNVNIKIYLTGIYNYVFGV